MTARSLLRYLQKGKFKAVAPYQTATASIDTSHATVQQELRRKRQVTATATEHLPEYTDAFLQDIYDSLNAPEPVPELPPKMPLIPGTERMKLLTERMMARGQSEDGEDALTKLERSVQLAEAEGAVSFAIGSTTQEEWVALVHSAVRFVANQKRMLTLGQLERKDDLSLFKSLDLVLRTRHPAADGIFVAAMALCAKHRNPKLAVDVLNIYQQAGLTPTADMHHGLLSAYIKTNDVVAAQRHLRKMEELGIRPSSESYRMAIIALRSTSQQQAWNLFAHMRLVSYPIPDVATYNLMINACGNAKEASPERATDLFVEMQEHRLEPTAATYVGLIKACSRAVRKGEAPFYFQAIEYFRQMLAQGFQATRGTLHALLMGCRTVGDLGRARWIFYRMLAADPSDDVAINEKTVALLFNSYAAYVPPQRRPRHGDSVVNGSGQQAPIALDADEEGLESLSQLPQTSREARDQLRGLLARILVAHGRPIDTVFPELELDLPEAQAELYRQVSVGTQLLNAFLAAHMEHASFEMQAALFDTLFDAAHIAKNGTSYALLMRACTGPEDKDAALVQARKVFANWKEWAADQPLQAMEAKAVWITYIRILARSDLVQEAMAELAAFQEALPPSLLVDHASQKARLAALAPRPLISLADDAYPETTTDQWQPPMLRSGDFVMLHKRLADAERRTDIRKLKHTLSAYKKAEAEARQISKSGRVQTSKRQDGQEELPPA